MRTTRINSAKPAGFLALEIFGVWLIVCTCMALILSPWTWRNLEFWVCYAKGIPEANISYLAALGVSFLWPIAFTANVIGEIARLFV